MKILKSVIAVLTALVFLSTQVNAFGGTDTGTKPVKDPASKTASVAAGNGEKAKEAEFKPVAIAGTSSPAPQQLKKKFPWLIVIAAVVVVGGVAAYLLLKKPAATTGSIAINSSPTGAKIFLDDADQNKTTNTVLKDISAGSHVVKLVKEGYQDYTETVTVKADATVSVAATMVQNVITVTNPTASVVWAKGAQVEILWTTDTTVLRGTRNLASKPTHEKGMPDEEIGSGGTAGAPVIQSFDLSITNVNIALYKAGTRVAPIATNVANSGAATWTVPASQTDGTDYRARVECAAETTIFGQSEQFSIGGGSISITSNPTGAEVFLDGIDQNKTTNCTLTDVAAGTHKVKLTKSGYLDYTQDVAVTIGQTASISATLQIGSISVTSPAADVIWGRGETRTISWSSSVSGNVKIELYSSSTLYGTIVSPTGNTGGYTWTIPSGQTEKMDYKIRVSLVADANIKGDSGYFVIAKKTYTPDFVSTGLTYPIGIAIDSSGYAHVTEYYNNRVAKFYPAAGSPSKTYYGSSGTALGNFGAPIGVQFDKVYSRMYVAEYGNHRVQQFSGTTYSSPAGIGGPSPGSGSYQFNGPVFVVTDKSGNFYVTDYNNNRVQKYSPSRTWQGSWSLPGTHLLGIASDENNNWIFIADSLNKKIFVYSTTGSQLASWTCRGTPYGIAVDSAGFLYITDNSYYCFDKYTPDGRLVCSVGSLGDAADQFKMPYGIDLDSSNNVFVVDYTQGSVHKFK